MVIFISTSKPTSTFFRFYIVDAPTFKSVSFRLTAAVTVLYISLVIFINFVESPDDICPRRNSKPSRRKTKRTVLNLLTTLLALASPALRVAVSGAIEVASFERGGGELMSEGTTWMQDPDWVTEGGAGGGEGTTEHEWDEMSEGGELVEFGGGVDRIDVGHRRLDGCAWMTVSGCEDVQPTKMGTFELAGECDGRPMYEKSNGETLYYHSAELSLWVIGPNGCGSTTGVAVGATTTGAEPSSSSGWKCHDGGSWTFYSLSVVCVACSINCAAGSGCALQTDNSASCESCEVGDYSSTNDGLSCASCGSGTTESTGSTSAGQCICDANFYFNVLPLSRSPTQVSTKYVATTTPNENSAVVSSPHFP